METGLASSVLEFLLRNGVSDHVLKNAVRVIPFSDSNSRLKKSMLLRKIQSEIAKGSVSEDILEFLECIEELEHGEEMEASEAMKRAYCAVAVECAVRCLGKGNEEWEYFSAVKRIWRGRILTMEMSEKVGLLSDELRIWKEEIELAIWDPNTGENLRLKSREINALEAVAAYVAEAWAGMGPSCLEGDDIDWESLGMTNTLHEQAGEGDVGLPGSRHDSVVSNGKNGKQRGLRRKYVAVKRSRGATRTYRAKTTGEEMTTQTSWNNHDPEPGPEINEVKKALRTSPLELKAGLQDHLRDAIHTSECINDDMVRGNMYQEPSAEGKSSVDAHLASCVEKRGKTAPINDTSVDYQLPISTSCSEQNVKGQIGVDSKLLDPYVGKGVEAALMKEANVENGQPSQKICVELKVPLTSPSVGESAETAPINEIALGNQQPTRENSSELKVVVEDPCSDILQLPKNRTVITLRESLNGSSVEQQNTVDSRRSLNRCVRKSVEATLVNEIKLEGQQPKETNCLELNVGLKASLSDAVLLSDNSKSGMVRETMDQKLAVEKQSNVESKPHRPLVEKIIEATMANGANLDSKKPIQTCLEPEATTQDPLPDALRFPGNASSSTCRENTNQEPTEVGKSDLGEHSNHIGKTAAEATTKEEVCLHCPHCRNQNNVPKPSFMERKRTCHTYEGDDSIETSAVDSPKRENKPHLSSPKRKAVSPLRKNETKRVGRRKVRRWSTLEEDTLRAAVQKYDIGNWKFILDLHCDIFQGRSAVDLKDKWRNLLRYNAV